MHVNLYVSVERQTVETHNDSGVTFLPCIKGDPLLDPDHSNDEKTEAA